MRRRDRQLRGIDAFAQCVVHRQVFLGVQSHGPDSVVVVVRPSGRRYAATLREVAGEERIYYRWEVFVLPGQ